MKWLTESCELVFHADLSIVDSFFAKVYAGFDSWKTNVVRNTRLKKTLVVAFRRGFLVSGAAFLSTMHVLCIFCVEILTRFGPQLIICRVFTRKASDTFSFVRRKVPLNFIA